MTPAARRKAKLDKLKRQMPSLAISKVIMMLHRERLRHVLDARLEWWRKVDSIGQKISMIDHLYELIVKGRPDAEEQTNETVH